MDTPRMGIPERLAERMTMPEQHEYLRRKLSRRRVLRGGGIATAGALGGAGALALATGAGASLGEETAAAAQALPAPAAAKVDGSLVSPFGRHLAFGADPKTQMRVSWQVPLPVRRPYLRVGLQPWDLDRKIEAAVRDLHTPSLGAGDKTPAVDQLYLHVALDRLRPGTRYYYGVGHDGFDPAQAHRIATLGSFTTAPATPDEPFVFTAFGDQGVSYDALANDQVILGQNPAFHLHAGDLCYADDSGHGKKLDVYDARVWDQFMAQTESVARQVPWMVTTGNHDMEAWYSPNGYGGQWARWSLPDNGPDPRNAPGVYSFVHGNVGVVALDANDVSYQIRANRGHTDGKQTAWLDKRLARLRAERDVDFIVVFFHHCAYATSTHGSDGGVRDSWVGLFEKHQVDLVINGHNHVYERTDPIKGHQPSRTLPIGGATDPRRDGIVYVTAGGGGRELYGFPVPDSYEGEVNDRDSVRSRRWTKSGEPEPDRVEWSRVRYTGFSFIAIRSVPGARPRLEVTALAESGNRVDHFDVTHG